MYVVSTIAPILAHMSNRALNMDNIHKSWNLRQQLLHYHGHTLTKLYQVLLETNFGIYVKDMFAYIHLFNTFVRVCLCIIDCECYYTLKLLFQIAKIVV